MTEIVWVYNISEVQVAALADPQGLQLDERLQESETLSFTVRADDPKADYLDEDRVVRGGGRRDRITELTMRRDGSSVLWDVGAEALWIDLLGFPATTAAIVGNTISQGLGVILAGTNWTVGTVELDGGNYSLDTSVDQTALGLLRAWASMTSRELVFDTSARTVSLVVEVGEDRGLGFRYGRNLISVKRKSEPPVATRLYPVGAEGLSIAGVNPTGKPYVDNFSFYTDQGMSLAAAQATYLKVQRWEDARYLLALNLYDAAVARLAKLAQPHIAYELSVVELSALTGADETFAVGDSVRVDDAPTGTAITTRIVRKVTRPLQPERTEVELSYLDPGLVSEQTTNTSSGAGGSDVVMLVDLNASPLTVGGGQITLAGISIGVDAGDIANMIFGLELDATATGTGTVTVSFWYGATQVGPTIQQAFTAGPVHISVPDFLVGVTTSNAFTAKAQVTSGTGTLSVPLNSAHLYILGTGIAGGGVSGAAEVTIAEAVSYRSDVTEAAPVTLLLTPLDGSPTAESVDTTPATVTETVTAVTTP